MRSNSAVLTLSPDDAHLKTWALVLIGQFQLSGHTVAYRERAIEEALQNLEGSWPGRCTRSGWMDLLFAAMECEVKYRAEGTPLDIRAWWKSSGRPDMCVQMKRVRSQGPGCVVDRAPWHW